MQGGKLLDKKKSLQRIIVLIISALVLIAVGIWINKVLETKETSSEPYGYRALESFDHLPFLKLTHFAGGASSYDRSGGNYDGFDKGNYLYVDDHGDKVMLDLEGPGTVYRMWFTGFDEINSTIKIYFDGEEDPSIDMRLVDLFKGDKDPFVDPFVLDNFQSSGGFVSSVPLSFNESIKITTNGVGEHNFYNIGYTTYPPDVEVETWDGDEDRQTATDLWEKVWNSELANVKDDQDLLEDSITLESQSTQLLEELEGPQIIDWLTLTIPGIEPDADVEHLLQNIHLQAYWDGEEEPSVDAPIGSLFAMGHFEVYPTRSMYAGMNDDNEMYLNIPMPFEKNAEIILVNETDDEIENVSYKIAYRDFDESFDNVGYFTTQFRHQYAEAWDEEDLLILEEEGAGHFLGVVQSVQAELDQGIADRWHLEGDERIYVDHSKSPIIYGTGSEDFYNGGWYFGYGLFSTQLAGYSSVKVVDHVESSSYHRFFMGDIIPFRNHIRVSIEHGAENDVTEDAWLLAFYYYQPDERMKLTDSLDIGDPDSEKEHNYKIVNETWSGTSTHSYEGIYEAEKIEDTGRAHNGHSEFTMTISPDNDGVILRRRFDQLIANQKAKVYVDDEYVGNWYRAGENLHHGWRDTDFMIPSKYTEDKEEIQIKVEFQETSKDWSEFLYEVFTLH